MVDQINGVPQGNATPAPGTVPPSNVQNTPAPEGTPGSSTTPDGKQVPLAALQEERQKRQESQAALSDLQRQMADLQSLIQQQTQTQQQNVYPQTPQPVQANPLDQVWNNEEAWSRDPKAAVRNSVQAEILAALQWYDSQSVVIAGQEAETMRKYPDYVKYKPTVDAQLRRIPMNQRTQNGVVEAAYFMAKGQSVDQILTQQQQELIEKIKRGELVQGLQPGTTGAPPVSPQGQVNLTEDQLRAAAMMNMTPQEYASAMQVSK